MSVNCETIKGNNYGCLLKRMLYFPGSGREFLSALVVTFRTKKTLEACHTRVTPNAGKPHPRF